MTGLGPLTAAPALALVALLIGVDALAQQVSPINPVYLRLNPEDRAVAEKMVQETLESRLSRQTHRWNNIRTGTTGYITPVRSFRIRTGHYCRDYRETVMFGFQLDTADFTACRNDDGLWERVR